jgi:uncharacterized protein YbaP (TraB family)
VRILGSIHFLRPGRDSLPAAVLAAYDDADVVVMEIDLDRIDPVAAQATMQELGVVKLGSVRLEGDTQEKQRAATAA